MCQAYEAEAASIRSSEAADRCRKYESDGRIARQNSVSRNDWMKLVYHVDLEKEDGGFNTPSWWMAHHFDGPLIKAWLAGWDDEDVFLKAGGTPLTAHERQNLLDRHREISFLFYDEVQPYGNRIRGIEMEGFYLSKILMWADYDDWANYKNGSWRISCPQKLEIFQKAMTATEEKLYPHHKHRVLAYKD